MSVFKTLKRQHGKIGGSITRFAGTAHQGRTQPMPSPGRADLEAIDPRDEMRKSSQIRALLLADGLPFMLLDSLLKNAHDEGIE
jgi:hypothetical protein